MEIDELEDNKKEVKDSSLNNSMRVMLTPIVISVILVFGFFIGQFFTQRNIQKTELLSTLSVNNSNKIFTILDLVKENYVDSISEKDLIEKTIPSMLKQLDPHSVYIPASQMQAAQEPLDGKFEGIGVQFNMQNDTIVVVHTISGGPSEKVGILAGDRIVTINDSLFAGVKASNQKIMKYLKGKKGTTVEVGIKRNGFNKLLEFEITRDEIPLYSVDVSYMIDSEIGYVKVSKFAGTTYDEFKEAVDKLISLGMKKIVLDLRSNGGGYMRSATGMVDEFLSEGKMIVYTEGRTRPRKEYRATTEQKLKGVEAIVLIDAWSASASEIVSGALQDNDRAIIVGQRSFGKGLVQESMKFPDGSGLRITTARYYTPTGRCIQKPYGKNTDYDHELEDRYLNGEFMHVDSSQFVDSLKFITPGGKAVYGGGGIMPDIFVPRDTSGYSKYFSEIVRKGLVFRFAFKYSDKNRKRLSHYKTAKEINNYLNNANLLPLFVAFAEKNGVKRNSKEIHISRKIILTQIKAYIARNIIDNDGFYPILNEIDYTLQKGIEVLKNE